MAETDAFKRALTDPDAPRRAFAPAAMPSRTRYHLMNSIIVPRPIAWVSTMSETGIANLAPHSYCTVVSTDPPIIAFTSIGAKDTLRNVRATGEFVFNLVTEALAEAMNLSAADFPGEMSEFDWTGLTPVPSAVVRPPRVGESPVALECRVLSIQEYGNTPSYLILGEVVHFALDPVFMRGDILDPARTRPVGRLMHNSYSRTREFYDMPRPTYRGLTDAGTARKRGPHAEGAV